MDAAGSSAVSYASECLHGVLGDLDRIVDAVLADPEEGQRGGHYWSMWIHRPRHLDVPVGVGDDDGIVTLAGEREVGVYGVAPGAGVCQHDALVIGDLSGMEGSLGRFERCAGHPHTVDSLPWICSEHQHHGQGHIVARRVTVLTFLGRIEPVG